MCLKIVQSLTMDTWSMKNCKEEEEKNTRTLHFRHSASVPNHCISFYLFLEYSLL